MKLKASFLFFFVCEVLAAQNNFVDLIIAKADSLYESGNYFFAITEYKRAIFFEKDKTFRSRCFYKIGLSYKYGGFFEKAIENFGRAIISSSDSIFILNCRIQIARCQLLNGNIDAARYSLLGVPDTFRGGEKFYWLAWIAIVESDFYEAKKLLLKVENSDELSRLADKFENQTLNEHSLKIFSYILPNVLYLYFGDCVGFIASSFYIYGSGYLTYKAFINKRVIEGVLIGNLVFSRFYRGIIEDHSKRIEIEKKKFRNKFIEYLQKEYKGEKP